MASQNANSLLDLPNELLQMIGLHLSQADFKGLRLSCKYLEAAYTGDLFESYTLYSDIDSFSKFRQFATESKLVPLVQKFIYDGRWLSLTRTIELRARWMRESSAPMEQVQHAQKIARELNKGSIDPKSTLDTTAQITGLNELLPEFSGLQELEVYSYIHEQTAHQPIPYDDLPPFYRRMVEAVDAVAPNAKFLEKYAMHRIYDDFEYDFSWPVFFAARAFTSIHTIQHRNFHWGTFHYDDVGKHTDMVSTLFANLKTLELDEPGLGNSLFPPYDWDNASIGSGSELGHDPVCTGMRNVQALLARVVNVETLILHFRSYNDARDLVEGYDDSNDGYGGMFDVYDWLTQR